MTNEDDLYVVFAAFALCGILASRPQQGTPTAEQDAATAFNRADAMIRELNSRTPPPLKPRGNARSRNPKP